jgi:isoquinoline 1-oxidoreductase beta subunit
MEESVESGRSTVSRRKVLVYALSGSTLTLIAPLGAGLLSAEAGTAPRPGNHDQATSVAAGSDEEQLVLEITTTNRVVVRLPRAEVGQGDDS